jgi:hypothetical protein
MTNLVMKTALRGLPVVLVAGLSSCGAAASSAPTTTTSQPPATPTTAPAPTAASMYEQMKAPLQVATSNNQRGAYLVGMMTGSVMVEMYGMWRSSSYINGTCPEDVHGSMMPSVSENAAVRAEPVWFMRGCELSARYWDMKKFGRPAT